MFYQEQKTQRQKDALSAEDRLKHQEGINETIAIKNEMKEQQNINKSIGNINSINTDFNSLINISDSVENNEEESNKEKKNQAITESLELGGENSKEITFDEASSQLQSDDPWLQRKMEEQKNKTQ
jgi:hypothetical protein